MNTCPTPATGVRGLPRPVLSVTARPHGGVCVVTVNGTLDRATAAAFRTALIDAMGSVGPRIVLDLLGVHTGDDAGTREILAAATRARRRGGWLRVAAAPASVGTALAAAPERPPGVYPTVTDALAPDRRACF